MALETKTADSTDAISNYRGLILRKILVIIAGVAVLILTMVFAVTIGAHDLSMGDAFRINMGAHLQYLA